MKFVFCWMVSQPWKKRLSNNTGQAPSLKQMEVCEWPEINVKCLPRRDLATAVERWSSDKQWKSDDILNLVSVQSIPVLQIDLLQSYSVPSNSNKALQYVRTGCELAENLTLTFAHRNGEVIFTRAFCVRSPSCVGVCRGVGINAQSLFKLYSN